MSSIVRTHRSENTVTVPSARSGIAESEETRRQPAKVKRPADMSQGVVDLDQFRKLHSAHTSDAVVVEVDLCRTENQTRCGLERHKVHHLRTKPPRAVLAMTTPLIPAARAANYGQCAVVRKCLGKLHSAWVINLVESKSELHHRAGKITSGIMTRGSLQPFAAQTFSQQDRKHRRWGACDGLCS